MNVDGISSGAWDIEVKYRMSDLLYTVFTNIVPEYETEFNVWQETEHGPYLMGLPGYQSVIRYKDLDIPCRYANFWHIESMAAFRNPERLIRAQTPWGNYLSPYRDRRIDFYVQDNGLEEDPPQAELSSTFTMLLMETCMKTPDLRSALAGFYRERIKYLKEIPCVLDVKLFHGCEGLDSTCMFYYLSCPPGVLEGDILPEIDRLTHGRPVPVFRKKLLCISQNSVIKTYFKGQMIR